MVEFLAHVAEIAIVVVPCFLWFMRWTRKLETTIALTAQIASEHLPFIYTRLKRHDNALGIENPEHPNIGVINGIKYRGKTPSTWGE